MANQRVVYNWFNAVCSIKCPDCGTDTVVDSENGEVACYNPKCNYKFRLSVSLTVLAPVIQAEILPQTEISQTGAARDQQTGD